VSAAGQGVAYLVDTMSRLRAPGGCPWDAQQTHGSLVQYLLEESYEAAEAIEDGDRQDLREELGDVLLQVVFHSSIAAEHPDDPFDLDDLASGAADKLVRRHPHVFASDQSERVSAEESYKRWDQIKADEKSRRSVLDGIPVAQSPLARAQKVFGRARRAGLRLSDFALDDAAAAGSRAASESAARAASGAAPGPASGVASGPIGAGRVAVDSELVTASDTVSDLGERLAALAAEADALGLDAEKELRAATRRVEARIRQIEQLSEQSQGGVA
jgi:XTP/dITP diphosphohydrolase